MRKSVLTALLVCLMGLNAYAEGEGVTPASLPDTLTFQGIEFHRAYEKESDGVFIVEYLPEGESLERWFYLFAVRKERLPLPPLEHARQIAQMLPKINPEFRSQVLYDRESNTAGIDFLIWPEDDAYGEFNSWKYMQAEPGWLYSYQFGRRGYTDEPSWDALAEFMTQKKQKAVGEMMEYKLQLKEQR